MKMKAISPIIATVILVAVTIALAVGVALWMSGLIGGAGSREQLKVMPDSTLQVDDSGSLQKLSLHLVNTGTADSKIISVTFNGINQQISSPIIVKAGGGTTYLVFTPGNFTSATALTAGATYEVKVYTEAGNVYTQDLTAMLTTATTTTSTTTTTQSS